MPKYCKKGDYNMDIDIAIIIGLIVGAIVGGCVTGGIIYAGLQKIADAINKQR
jgi:hypothetical protein